MSDTLNASSDDSRTSSTTLLDEIRTAVAGYEAKANYACGGSIPISANPVREYGSSENPINCPPVTLRFDTADGGQSKIHFPCRNQDELKELLKACAPATFGFEGNDVLDETYRKAGKLDDSQFCIDWHPTEYGIVDAIKQALLPGIYDGKLKGSNTIEEHRGVIAELYKLCNIYSGPSGKFQKHVDTPRGPTQFGSLVVCLPVNHQGGQLRVAHKGQDTFFAWGAEEQNMVKWAAFYSDCEHEVLEVKSGHRVTLTYNLYVCEQSGGLLNPYPTADPSLYPLYKVAKNIVDQPVFMKRGGVIGFFCRHLYAHNRCNTNERMPFALKGIDVAVFSIFKVLGFKVHVRPVLDNDEFAYNDQKSDFEVRSRIGKAFHAMKLINTEFCGGDDDLEGFISGGWRLRSWKGIRWLNTPTKDGMELAYVGLRYGNETDLMWHYSHAAILIVVPAASDRNIIPGSDQVLVSEPMVSPEQVAAPEEVPASGEVVVSDRATVDSDPAQMET